MKHNIIAQNAEAQHLAANCYIKQGKYEEAMLILGDSNPTHLISSRTGNRRKVARLDVNGRGSGARHGKSVLRTEILEISDKQVKESPGDIRMQAAMCYLRGLCCAKQNALDRAKECYKDAVRIDVQCFEAFNQLMKNALMSPEEEWEFLESLDFDSVCVGDNSSFAQEAAELTKMLYTTRLSKYNNQAGFTAAIETLSTHYELSADSDLLLSKANLFFTQCRFSDALALTEAILENDRYNFDVLPLHVACLHEMNEKNALFLLAHDIADHHPEESVTWFAVGSYYLTIGKIAEARRFYSKASMMDPHFGPAWLGFAHTFAAEGEHDQAISAYATAARLYQGTHLPQLFLGMQNLQLQNMTLAREYLNAAYSLCSTDPLLLNELGVIYYHDGDMLQAVNTFTTALTIAQEVGAEAQSWIATRANLGHAYRRSERWEEALREFEEVLRNGGRDTSVFCAKALVLLEMGLAIEAVVALHEALAISPQDPIANDLLNKALEETAGDCIDSAFPEDELEELVNIRIKGFGAKGGATQNKQHLGERDRNAMDDG